ncbi:MAG: asparagine synthase (glutamine-hydrolyzing) [Elusimicrobiota bacterium]
MCGIAGLFQSGPGFDAEAARRLLERSAGAMAHRGPDAAGIRVLPEGLGLAHRRLSILDLDPRSDQPMVSADGRFSIVFNGEVYNYRALREELRAEGGSFRTESDTEVVLEAARVWGLERLLPRLAGMFAFALHDARTGRLVLARDRAGKKPLFYCVEGGRISFASELRGLLPLMLRAPAPDADGIDDYLTLKFVPSPNTLLAGVRRLPPGHLLVQEAGGEPRVERWWQPYAAAATAGGSLEERLDGLLRTAVARRLVSDVPVCLFLSGGIDSGLIASYLGETGGAGMAAYTASYPDLPGYSETDAARLSARAFGLDHREVALDSAEVLRLLRDDALVLDEPVSDWVWVPLYGLCRRARADGFKVALVGEGSDETFFGYDVMLDALTTLGRARDPRWRLLARGASALLAPLYRATPRGHQRFDLWRRIAAGEPAYLGSSVGFPPSLHPHAAGPALGARRGERAIASVAGLYRLHAEHCPRKDDDEALVSLVEFYGKMSEILLQRVDRVSMLHALEARAPFLDHELVEFAFSLGPGTRLPGGRLKGLLRDFARTRLPSEICGRRKMGFSFPFKEWLRGELGSEVGRVFSSSRLFRDGWVRADFAARLLAEHRRGLADHAPRVWMLYSLARWYDRWVP